MGLLLPGSRFARALFAAMLLMLATAGHSQVEAPDADQLLVRNIRVEGLQRIAEGTVFNYLPVNIGDRIDQGRIQEAIRAIYGTGFFRDVEIRWETGSLIIVVSERPSIASFSITGNKDIKTEDLQEPLARIGLKQGRIFNQSVLDEVEQSLTRPVFQPRQVCGECHGGGGIAPGQQGGDRHHDQGRRPCPDPADQSGGQQQLQR
jgi:outer membrane protein assembly factor BamA